MNAHLPIFQIRRWAFLSYACQHRLPAARSDLIADGNHGFQAVFSSGLSAGSSSEFVGKASGMDSGSSISSGHLFRLDQSDNVRQVRQPIRLTRSAIRAGNTNADLLSSYLSGDSSGRSDLGNIDVLKQPRHEISTESRAGSGRYS
jgi:hypothetical protein